MVSQLRGADRSRGSVKLCIRVKTAVCCSVEDPTVWVGKRAPTPGFARRRNSACRVVSSLTSWNS